MVLSATRIRDYGSDISPSQRHNERTGTPEESRRPQNCVCDLPSVHSLGGARNDQLDLWRRRFTRARGRARVAQRYAKNFQGQDQRVRYFKREEMIPMRDGVKLKTLILVPKAATDAPMLLTRTPYNTAGRVVRFKARTWPRSCRRWTTPLSPPATSLSARQIRLRRRLRHDASAEGPLNPTAWIMPPTLTTPSSGWLSMCRIQRPRRHDRRLVRGLHHGHVNGASSSGAKAAVPFAPMVDGWIGDDWFHNGAFRRGTLSITFRTGSDSQGRRKVVVRLSRYLR